MYVRNRLRMVDGDQTKNHDTLRKFCAICYKYYGGTMEKHLNSQEHRRKGRHTSRGCVLCSTGPFSKYPEYVLHIDSVEHKEKKEKLQTEMEKRKRRLSTDIDEKHQRIVQADVVKDDLWEDRSNELLFNALFEKVTGFMCKACRMFFQDAELAIRHIQLHHQRTHIS